jgi:DNA-binding response OmpR family regulator
MRKQRILVVEDDPLAQGLLAAYLRKEGFEVETAIDGRGMHDALERAPVDLIFLDLTLPDEDGLVLTRKTRSRWTTPIVVLTARTDRDARLTALELGADDYLVKPFDPEELVLRARNLLRRSGGGVRREQSRLKFGKWTLDLAGRALIDEGNVEVPLAPAEYKLLVALAKAPGRVVSRAHLLDAVAREDATERMIDVLISRLRRKLDDDPKKPSLLVTVQGAGYKLVGVEGG